MEPFEVRVSSINAGKRIDIFLAEETGISRSQLRRHIDEGRVHVNLRPVKQNYRTKNEDAILIAIPEQEPAALIREPIPVDIYYQDCNIIVLNKPAGMVVYPSAGHAKGTLMNAVSYYSPGLATIGAPLRPGVVHRLDKDTSGVMVVALDDKSYYSLVEQFRQRTVQRMYKSLICGDIKEDEGRISAGIGRSVADRKKMSTRTKKAKEAVTAWKAVERFGSSMLIDVKLHTGRTHQIRVHFASIGHPVLGDRTYGKKAVIERKGRSIFFPRQMLHAGLLGFIHPVTGRYLEFSSPLPEDMEECIRELRGAGYPPQSS